LVGASFFIVTVPTASGGPTSVRSTRHARSSGRRCCRAAVVVFESTVYPGLTRKRLLSGRTGQLIYRLATRKVQGYHAANLWVHLTQRCNSV
jgi:UDP-N-acetyl-D-mannosaminuronate dehydrogenase